MASSYWRLFAVNFLTLSFAVNAVLSSPEEDRLLATLFNNDNVKYNPMSRPARRVRDSVDVTMDVVIASIIELNEQHEQLSLLLWYILKWNDYRLSWNASDYDDLDHLSIPTANMWIPDINLLNNNKDDSGRVGIDEDTDTKLIKVEADGSCTWFPSAVSVSHCSVDVTWFPFDSQVCKLQYELWGQDSRDVNLTAGYDRAYVQRGEDEHDAAPVSMQDFKFSASEDHTPVRVITYSLHLQRKPQHYIVNFVIPSFAFSVISLATFLLDPSSGERIGLSLTLLLSIAVYQMIINDKLPVSDSMPLLGIYFLFVMMMCAVSVLMFILVMFLTSLEKTMPRVLKKLVRSNVSHWLRLKRKVTDPPSDNGSRIDRNPDQKDKLLEHDTTMVEVSPTQEAADLVTVSVTDGLLKTILKLLQAKYKFKTDRFAAQNKKDTAAAEWSTLARIIDRVFFILFLLNFIIGTAVFACHSLYR